MHELQDHIHIFSKDKRYIEQIGGPTLLTYKQYPLHG